MSDHTITAFAVAAASAFYAGCWFQNRRVDANRPEIIIEDTSVIGHTER